MRTPQVSELLTTMNDSLVSTIEHKRINRPIMVGIHTGGAWVADQLHKDLNLADPLGLLDISFYRDDFSRIGMNPSVKPSTLPLSIDDRHIILVDDVLYTGRTVRAALNELFDYGRPASVLLAVLIDREGRELPIQADVVGQQLDLGGRKHIKLIGPAPLELSMVDALSSTQHDS